MTQEATITTSLREPAGLGNGFISFFERMSFRSFLLLLLGFNLLLTFQGVDLCDEGFMATYYEYIFTDPGSVAYNFMFWLTGIIGGAFAKLFPFLGLWGLRVVGVACLMLTVITTYRLLQDHIDEGILKIGLLIVVLMHNNDIKIINYNTLSALNYILLTGIMVKGLFSGRFLLLFLSGVLVAINIAIRIPNLTEFGLAAIILYFGFRQKLPVKSIFAQLMAFVAGIVVGLMLLYGIMVAIGHWHYFKDSVTYLFIMSRQQTDQSSNTGLYGVMGILKSFQSRNAHALVYAMALFGALGLFALSRDIVARKLPSLLRLFNLGFYLLYAALLAVVALRIIDHFNFLSLAIGVIYLLIGLFFLINDNRRLEIIMLIGAFFFVTYPIGSAYGIHSAGRFCLWIALPVGLNSIMQLEGMGGSFSLTRLGKQTQTFRMVFNRTQLQIIRILTIVLLIFGGLVYQFFYPFYDWHNRFGMTHLIPGNEKLRFIATSEKRAIVLEELFTASKKFIGEDDYVLAYDRMPMYYYATGTKSFLENPFPTVYAAEAFEYDLENALKRNKKLPIIVQNLFRTSGNGSYWPYAFEEKDYLSVEENGPRNKIYDAFTSKYQYREVWNNGLFRILQPGVKMAMQ